MVCPHCGKENPDNAVFCESCNGWIMESSHTDSVPAAVIDDAQAPAESGTSAPKRKKWLLAGVIGGIVLLVALCVVLMITIFDNGYIASKGEIFIYNNGVSDKIIFNDTVLEYEGDLYYISNSLDGTAAAFQDRNGSIVMIQNGKLSTISGNLSSYYLSVNGESLVYYSDDDSSIYLHNLRSGNDKLVADHVRILTLCISPDGESVAYTQYNEQTDTYTLVFYDGKSSKIDVSDTKMYLIGISNSGKCLYVLKNNELICYNKNGNANSFGDHDMYPSAPIIYSYGFNADHSQILFYNDGRTYIAANGDDPIEICAELVVPLMPPNTESAKEYTVSRTATYPTKDLFNQVYIQTHKTDMPDSITSGTITITNGYTAWYVPKHGAGSKLVDCSIEPVLDNSGNYLYYIDDGSLYVIKPSSSKNAAGYSKKLADGVVSFVVTSDRSTIYYISGRNLYSCNGKTGSDVQEIAEVYPSPQLYLNHADVLFCYVDRTIYVCSDGRSCFEAATNILGISSDPSGYVYILSDKTLYISYDSKDLIKIWDVE